MRSVDLAREAATPRLVFVCLLPSVIVCTRSVGSERVSAHISFGLNLLSCESDGLPRGKTGIYKAHHSGSVQGRPKLIHTFLIHLLDMRTWGMSVLLCQTGVIGHRGMLLLIHGIFTRLKIQIVLSAYSFIVVVVVWAALNSIWSQLGISWKAVIGCCGCFINV